MGSQIITLLIVYGTHTFPHNTINIIPYNTKIVKCVGQVSHLITLFKVCEQYLLLHTLLKNNVMKQLFERIGIWK